MELAIVISIIGILALIGVPEINRFIADSKVRSCATILVQNMRLARAMAMRENREYLIVFDTGNQRYLIGFDGDGDRNLLSINQDTFGTCKDTDGDRLPDSDTDADGDGVPDCVMVVNLRDCGANVEFGTLASEGPNGPSDKICKNGKACFGNTKPPRADFNPNGSGGNLGSVYLQHSGAGYSYLVRVSNNAGSINMWKWKGDIQNTNPSDPDNSQWIEVR